MAKTNTKQTTGFRFWQFTLREAMFALVALCALVALFSRPSFESSKFFSNFDAEKMVSEVIKDLDFTGNVRRHGEHLTDDDFAHRKAYVCLSGLSNAEGTYVVDALQAKITKQLDSNGCRYAANRSMTPEDKCYEFFFEYHSGNNYGTAFVFSDGEAIDESQEPRIRLVFVMHEFQHSDGR